MKKLLSILFLTGIICLSANAKEPTRVCANHILVQTEMDAIKSYIDDNIERTFSWGSGG